MKEIKSTLLVLAALAPAVRTASANGPSVPTANAGGNMIVINPGTITDGVHTPKLQHSDDGVAWTDVAADFQVGAFAPLATGVVQKASYIGRSPFIRLVVTVTGGPATGGVYGAEAIFSGRRKQPV